MTIIVTNVYPHSQIGKHLSIGGGPDGELQEKWVADNYDAVVCVAWELCPRSSPGGKITKKDGKPTYFYVGLADEWGAAADPMQIKLAQQASEIVARLVQAKKQTLVHCIGGINRSATVCSLAICKLTGCTPDKAIALVKKMHPRAFSIRISQEWTTMILAQEGNR